MIKLEYSQFYFRALYNERTYLIFRDKIILDLPTRT